MLTAFQMGERLLLQTVNLQTASKMFRNFNVFANPCVASTFGLNKVLIVIHSTLFRAKSEHFQISPQLFNETFT